jgi:copper homeostasis protein
MDSKIIIEICCSDIHSVQLAESYGADAIELCIDLEHGGLTPSLAMIQKARKVFTKEMAVFFRPRNGDFVYDEFEKEIILTDIKHALDCGIDAIVSGGLTADGDFDLDFMKELIDSSMGITLSYHRAIDIAKNPISLLEQLIELQIDRVLSSGCATNAYDGIECLSNWNKLFGDKIQIMAAGGIDHKNVKNILDKTGLKRFHASLRNNVGSKNEIMDLGSSEVANEEKLRKLFDVFDR